MAEWEDVEGTPAQKVAAIKYSKAFVVNWGFRPPVQYNVRVKGDTIYWTETDEGRRQQMTTRNLIRNLEELDNPPVEVSYDYPSGRERL